jgi:hypothetical protein
MKTSLLLPVLVIGALGLGTTALADGKDGKDGRGHRNNTLRAKLKADNEIPIVISNATGEFRGKIDFDQQTIEYELTYDGLEGPVTQSHIHAAQPFANGGIVIWLCQTGQAAAPAGTPACPTDLPATVTGTIEAADIVAPAGQSIAAQSFADALEAILGGNAYVNVHSGLSPGGEIRGQIR